MIRSGSDRSRAPGILGAFFFACVLPWLAGCERKHGTPDWNPAVATQPAIPAQTGQAPPAPSADEPVPFRFVAYNLQNWLTQERATDQGVVPASKPEASKRAVIELLASARPEVLGVCEIGDRNDLADVQQRLKAAGIELPHTYFTGGVDATRHLGLLSRFPIVSTEAPGNLDYRLGGRAIGMQRGILDATVEIAGKPVRFLGVHLKSKRPVAEGDQAEMRLHEAHLLRRHLDTILAAHPHERLIVYGDFNDTKASDTLKTIQGPFNHERFLAALPLVDRQGNAWTHAWEAEDLYSRYDWILTSQALKGRIDLPGCRIVDEPAWREASDHRPVLAVFK
ncbi:MAG TPA: endonuclease/exonuclease/phosphatase family protein [Luteolibacter sp.]